MFIGIDNGLQGGIAVLDHDGSIVDLYVMPRADGPRCGKQSGSVVDARGLSQIIGLHPQAADIAVERPMGARDAAAAMSMADSFATCRTIILCRARKLHAVEVHAWQKSFWKTPSKKERGGQKFDTKKAALAAAKAIWPQRDFLASARAYVPHDGLVDACLIAEYLRRKTLNLLTT